MNKFTKIAALLIGLAFLAPSVSFAAPKTFCYDGMTVGTTTPNVMTPGTGTTTITTSNCADSTYALDSLNVVGQLTGTSTASVIVGRVEDSIDGIDWYNRQPNELASTTPNFGFSAPSTFQVTFASSTQDQSTVTNAKSTIFPFIVSIRPLLRYTRVIFTTPIGSANSMIWAKLVGVRESLGGGR